MLVVLLLSVLRVLCLSLMVALIYSGAVLITFIFVVMTFDQSDILCIPSYKFIPLLVLYIEGFIPYGPVLIIICSTDILKMIFN